VFPVKARRQQAGEWRARRVENTPKRDEAKAATAWWQRPTRAIAPTAPRWKVGASIALPLASASERWDGAAAAAGIYELADLNTPWADSAMARKAHLIYDAGSPSFKASYRLPFAKVIDGVLAAVPAGLAQAAHDLATCADLPDDVRTKARAVIEHYRSAR
jgi:hypothetical protein